MLMKSVTLTHITSTVRKLTFTFCIKELFLYNFAFTIVRSRFFISRILRSVFNWEGLVKILEQASFSKVSHCVPLTSHHPSGGQ